MKNLIKNISICSAFVFLSFTSLNAFAQFGTVTSGMRHWFGSELSQAGSIKDSRFGNYQNLAAISVHNHFKAGVSGWKIGKLTNYNSYGQETRPRIYEIQVDKSNIKDDVPTSAYYFIEREKNGFNQRLVIQLAEEYIYFPGDASWYKDVLYIHYARGSEKVAEEFRAEFSEYLTKKNIYLNSILEGTGGGNFKIKFMDNISTLNMKWDDLILEKNLHSSSFALTEGFLKLIPELERFGVKSKKGVLLAGPPGTGKSLLGQVLISSILKGKLKNATLFYVSARHLNFKHSVKILFEEARRLSPSVIFMEDVDLLGVNNRKNSWEFSETGKEGILNEFLNSMDGISDSSSLLFVASTNAVKSVDPALLRAGRMGVHLEFGLPKYAQIKEFFLRFAQSGTVWEPGVTIDWLSGEAEGLSGADIVELIAVAKQIALTNGSMSGSKIYMEKAHFVRAFEMQKHKVDE